MNDVAIYGFIAFVIIIIITNINSKIKQGRRHSDHPSSPDFGGDGGGDGGGE